MEEKEFKRPELEDRELLLPFFEKYPSRSCERTFVNVLLWSRAYPVKWAIFNDVLVFKSEDENHVSFAFPLGEDEKIKNLLPEMKAYSESKGRAFSMYCVTHADFARLDSWCPGEYVIDYDRDMADYVYESEKLATLAGKKLHGKRNHVNKFKSEYEGRWSYESMGDDNIEECFQMGLKWRNENGCDDDEEKNAEICVTLNSLRLFHELELVGGVLKLDGKVIAFTIGEPLCKDTFVVHIEKAFSDIPGDYAMINQQFVQHECSGYKYVNREEDTGAEGLRQAKLTYRPAFLEEKGAVVEAKNADLLNKIEDQIM